MTISQTLMAVGLLASALSCSEQSNINGLITTDSQRGNNFYLIERAQHYYDKGEFAEARDLAVEAYLVEPNSEGAALLLGYIHLALAGIDSFALIRKLSEGGATLRLAGSGGGASGTLSSLSSIIGMDDTERQKLTLSGNKVGSIDGAPKTGPFQGLPVLLPLTATEARDGSSEVVRNLFLAMRFVCPFVDEEVLLREGLGDPRHMSSYCEPCAGLVSAPTRMHYIWAFAHLAEAIAFHGVVLYAPNGGDPNLLKRSEALEGALKSGTLDLDGYVSAVTVLASTVDVILPTKRDKTRDSMLNAMFNDFEAAGRGFARISGLPDTFTKDIDASLADLREKQARAGAKTQDVDTGSGAMKEQLTAGLAKNIKKQIEEKDNKGELEAGKKTELCAAYRTMSSEAFANCDVATP